MVRTKVLYTALLSLIPACSSIVAIRIDSVTIPKVVPKIILMNIRNPILIARRDTAVIDCLFQFPNYRRKKVL
jgi:hypothetical protein